MEEDIEDKSLIPLILGLAMETKIYHICIGYMKKKEKDVIEINGVKNWNITVILCLGKSTIFIFKEDLRETFKEIKYEDIDHVCIENHNKYFTAIVNKNFTGNYSDDNSLFFTLPHRNYFLENLICYHSVYHITELKEMIQLRLEKKEKILDIKGENYIYNYKNIYHNPPSRYKAVMIQNYM
jgi:hypothetical protein